MTTDDDKKTLAPSTFPELLSGLLRLTLERGPYSSVAAVIVAPPEEDGSGQQTIAMATSVNPTRLVNAGLALLHAAVGCASECDCEECGHSTRRAEAALAMWEKDILETDAADGQHQVRQ